MPTNEQISAWFSQSWDRVTGYSPSPALATLIVVLIALALWLGGTRLLKPVFLVAGLCFGTWLGMALAVSFFPQPIFTVPSALPGMIIGGLGLCLLATAGFRLTLACVSGFIFCIVGMAITMAILTYAGMTAGWPSIMPTHAGTLGEYAVGASEHWSLAWRGLSGLGQLALLVGGMIGTLGGLAVGVFAPNRAAAIITAPLGAAVVLAITPAVLTHFGVNPAPVDQLSTPARLGVWVLLSVVGLAVQFWVLGPRKKPSSSASGASQPASA